MVKMASRGCVKLFGLINHISTVVKTLTTASSELIVSSLEGCGKHTGVTARER